MLGTLDHIEAGRVEGCDKEFVLLNLDEVSDVLARQIRFVKQSKGHGRALASLHLHEKKTLSVCNDKLASPLGMCCFVALCKGGQILHVRNAHKRIQVDKVELGFILHRTDLICVRLDQITHVLVQFKGLLFLPLLTFVGPFKFEDISAITAQN